MMKTKEATQPPQHEVTAGLWSASTAAGQPAAAHHHHHHHYHHLYNLIQILRKCVSFEHHGRSDLSARECNVFQPIVFENDAILGAGAAVWNRLGGVFRPVVGGPWRPNGIKRRPDGARDGLKSSFGVGVGFELIFVDV